MSIAQRDREAMDLVAARRFDDAYLVSSDLEMQARRLTLRAYGALHPADTTTYLATLTFFGASALGIENEAGVFPESVQLSSLALTYDDADDEGSAELRGRQAWALAWNFDGLAYEEHPAVLASLADDL